MSVCNHYTKPDLYNEADEVIALYETKAQRKLEQSARIPFVDEPIEDSKHYDLVCQVANEMWLDDTITDR